MAKKKQEENGTSTRMKTRSSTTRVQPSSSPSPATRVDVNRDSMAGHHKKLNEPVHCPFCSTFSSMYQHSLERHLSRCKSKVTKGQQVVTSSIEEIKEEKKELKEEKICESTTRLTRQKNQSKEPNKVVSSPDSLAMITSCVTKCPRCPFEARYAFSITRHFKTEHNQDYLLILEGKKTVKGLERVEPSLSKTTSGSTTICDANNNKPDDPALSISRAISVDPVDPVVVDSKVPDEKKKETTVLAADSNVDRMVIRERRSIKAPIRYSPSSSMRDTSVTSKPRTAKKAESSLTTVITSDATNCPFCRFYTKYAYSMSRHMKFQHPKDHSLILEGKKAINWIHPNLPKKEKESQSTNLNEEKEDRNSEKCIRKRRRKSSEKCIRKRRKSSEGDATESNQLTRDEILRLRPERQREYRRLYFRSCKKQKVTEDGPSKQSESGEGQEKQLLKEVWQRKWKRNRHKKQPKSLRRIIVNISSKWNDKNIMADKPKSTTLEQQDHKVAVPAESHQRLLLRKEREKEYRKKYYFMKSQNSRAELAKRRSRLLADLQTISPENYAFFTKEVSTIPLANTTSSTNCQEEVEILEKLPLPVPSSPITIDVEENDDAHENLPVVVSMEPINVQDPTICPEINTTTAAAAENLTHHDIVPTTTITTNICPENNTATISENLTSHDVTPTATNDLPSNDVTPTATTTTTTTIDPETNTTTTENLADNDVTPTTTTTTTTTICEEDDAPVNLTVSSTSSSSSEGNHICLLDDVPQDISVLASNEPTNMELDTSCEEINNTNENLPASPTTTEKSVSCQEDDPLDTSDELPVPDSTEPVSTTVSEETNTPEDLTVALPVTYIDYTTGGQRNNSSEISTPPTYIDYTTKLHFIKREVIKEEYYY